MRLEIGKVSETRDWHNKDFNAKYLALTLKEEGKRPAEARIYFADKSLILEKKLFDGMPYLNYKPDPANPFTTYKLTGSIALDRRYAFYYVKVEFVEYVELIHQG